DAVPLHQGEEAIPRADREVHVPVEHRDVAAPRRCRTRRGRRGSAVFCRSPPHQCPGRDDHEDEAHDDAGHRSTRGHDTDSTAGVFWYKGRMKADLAAVLFTFAVTASLACQRRVEEPESRAVVPVPSSESPATTSSAGAPAKPSGLVKEDEKVG